MEKIPKIYWSSQVEEEADLKRGEQLIIERLNIIDSWKRFKRYIGARKYERDRPIKPKKDPNDRPLEGEC